MSKWEGKMNFKDMKKKEEKLKILKEEKIRGFNNLEEMIVEDINKLEEILPNQIRGGQLEN